MQKILFRNNKIPSAKLALWQVMGAFILFAAIVTLAFTVSSDQWQNLLQNLLDNQGWGASLILTGVYILAVILMVPLSPFAITAGVFFGFWQGAVIALIAINAGALVSFIITRHLISRHWLSRNYLHKSIQSSSMRLLTSNNIKIISLLRMNPLVPFSLHNYLYGAAKTNLRPYLWGTLLGSAPFTLVLVYFGVTGRVIYRTGSASLGPWQYSMIGLGIVLSVVLVALTKYAKSASHFSD